MAYVRMYENCSVSSKILVHKIVTMSTHCSVKHHSHHWRCVIDRISLSESNERHFYDSWQPIRRHCTSFYHFLRILRKSQRCPSVVQNSQCICRCLKSGGSPAAITSETCNRCGTSLMESPSESGEAITFRSSAGKRRWRRDDAMTTMPRRPG